MTSANQTHNRLKYKQGPSVFMFSKKCQLFCSSEMCLSVWQNTLLHPQADLFGNKIIVPRLLGEREFRVKGAG